RRDTGLADAPESSKSVASGTPSPVAIFSNTTAVGLLSPRSTNEIIDRLTSHCPASASRVIPRSVRSARTRLAMRALMSGVTRVAAALSRIMETISSMIDRRQPGLDDDEPRPRIQVREAGEGLLIWRSSRSEQAIVSG